MSLESNPVQPLPRRRVPGARRRAAVHRYARPPSRRPRPRVPRLAHARRRDPRRRRPDPEHQGRRGHEPARFSFRDGSRHDETAVFTQGRVFHLRSYKLVQKGPSFERPTEVTLDAADGRVTVRHENDKGEVKVETETIEVPTDLANGMVPILLKNVRPEAPPTMSMLAATPGPRLVTRDECCRRGVVPGRGSHAQGHALRREGEDRGSGRGARVPPRQAAADTHVWILGGEAPAFVKSEGRSTSGARPGASS